jgi:hypothetical protein
MLDIHLVYWTEVHQEAPLLERSTAKIRRSMPRARTSAPEAITRRRLERARVVVVWSGVSDAGMPSLEPTEVELEAELEAAASTTWTCRTPSDFGWAEALSAARCTEVLLTAHSDVPSKHLVFELAGQLTLKLAATRPLIRVRFLPPSDFATPR